jgi:hypothetical protein
VLNLEEYKMLRSARKAETLVVNRFHSDEEAAQPMTMIGDGAQLEGAWHMMEIEDIYFEVGVEVWSSWRR